MKNWSERVLLNCQIINQDTVQKYLKITMLFFTKGTPKFTAIINPNKIQYRN